MRTQRLSEKLLCAKSADHSAYVLIHYVALVRRSTIGKTRSWLAAGGLDRVQQGGCWPNTKAWRPSSPTCRPQQYRLKLCWPARFPRKATLVLSVRAVAAWDSHVAFDASRDHRLQQMHVGCMPILARIFELKANINDKSLQSHLSGLVSFHQTRLANRVNSFEPSTSPAIP